MCEWIFLHLNCNTSSDIYSIYLLQTIYRLFGPCQLLSFRAAIIVCAAVFTANPRRLGWDLFTLYLSLPGRWRLHSFSLSTCRQQTASAHLLSLLLHPLCVPPGHQECILPPHTLHRLHTFLKQQFVFFLHVLQSEVTLITALVRFQTEWSH